ncbi:hypothetical protein [Merdimmobilis hominis]|uniref:hypothetical protein n=1 Tax=Merdimmobilis hominis TaxID=2897707 RepID=UPI003513EEC0
MVYYTISTGRSQPYFYKKILFYHSIGFLPDVKKFLDRIGKLYPLLVQIASRTRPFLGYSAPIPGMLTIKTNGNEGINDE